MTSTTGQSVSRRTALAGLGAGGLAVALDAIARHAATSQAAAQDATPGGVRYDHDVVFGEVDGQPLLLDVARPASQTEPVPAVIVIHGGGFVVGDRSFLADPMAPLAAAGYAAFNIEYRLFGSDGSNPWPVQLDDAQRAVRWVRAHADRYGVDPKHVGAYGHSAGGTLVAHLATRETRDNSDPALAAYPSRVECVVDIAGDTDPTIAWPNADDTARIAALLGGTPAEVPAAYRDYSALAHVSGKSAPFLVLHGTGDTFVPVEHSRHLVDALHKAEVETVYGEFPHIDHLDWNWNKAGPWALAFFGQHLRPDGRVARDVAVGNATTPTS